MAVHCRSRAAAPPPGPPRLTGGRTHWALRRAHRQCWTPDAALPVRPTSARVLGHVFGRTQVAVGPEHQLLIVHPLFVLYCIVYYKTVCVCTHCLYCTVLYTTRLCVCAPTVCIVLYCILQECVCVHPLFVLYCIVYYKSVCVCTHCLYCTVLYTTRVS